MQQPLTFSDLHGPNIKIVNGRSVTAYYTRAHGQILLSRPLLPSQGINLELEHPGIVKLNVFDNILKAQRWVDSGLPLQAGCQRFRNKTKTRFIGSVSPDGTFVTFMKGNKAFRFKLRPFTSVLGFDIQCGEVMLSIWSSDYTPIDFHPTTRSPHLELSRSGNKLYARLRHPNPTSLCFLPIDMLKPGTRLKFKVTGPKEDKDTGSYVRLCTSGKESFPRTEDGPWCFGTEEFPKSLGRAVEVAPKVSRIFMLDVFDQCLNMCESLPEATVLLDRIPLYRADKLVIVGFELGNVNLQLIPTETLPSPLPVSGTLSETTWPVVAEGGRPRGRKSRDPRGFTFTSDPCRTPEVERDGAVSLASDHTYMTMSDPHTQGPSIHEPLNPQSLSQSVPRENSATSGCTIQTTHTTRLNLVPYSGDMQVPSENTRTGFTQNVDECLKRSPPTRHEIRKQHISKKLSADDNSSPRRTRWNDTKLKSSLQEKDESDKLPPAPSVPLQIPPCTNPSDLNKKKSGFFNDARVRQIYEEFTLEETVHPTHKVPQSFPQKDVVHIIKLTKPTQFKRFSPSSEESIQPQTLSKSDKRGNVDQICAEKYTNNDADLKNGTCKIKQIGGEQTDVKMVTNDTYRWASTRTEEQQDRADFESSHKLSKSDTNEILSASGGVRGLEKARDKQNRSKVERGKEHSFKPVTRATGPEILEPKIDQRYISLEDDHSYEDVISPFSQKHGEEIHKCNNKHGMNPSQNPKFPNFLAQSDTVLGNRRKINSVCVLQNEPLSKPVYVFRQDDGVFTSAKYNEVKAPSQSIATKNDSLDRLNQTHTEIQEVDSTSLKTSVDNDSSFYFLNSTTSGSSQDTSSDHSQSFFDLEPYLANNGFPDTPYRVNDEVDSYGHHIEKLKLGYEDSSPVGQVQEKYASDSIHDLGVARHNPTRDHGQHLHSKRWTRESLTSRETFETVQNVETALKAWEGDNKHPGWDENGLSENPESGLQLNISSEDHFNTHKVTPNHRSASCPTVPSKRSSIYERHGNQADQWEDQPRFYDNKVCAKVCSKGVESSQDIEKDVSDQSKQEVESLKYLGKEPFKDVSAGCKTETEMSSPIYVNCILRRINCHKEASSGDFEHDALRESVGGKETLNKNAPEACIDRKDHSKDVVSEVCPEDEKQSNSMANIDMESDFKSTVYAASTVTGAGSGADFEAELRNKSQCDRASVRFERHSSIDAILRETDKKQQNPLSPTRSHSVRVRPICSRSDVTPASLNILETETALGETSDEENVRDSTSGE